MWVKKDFLSGFESVGQHLLSTARGHLRKLAESLGKVLNLSSLSFLYLWIELHKAALSHRIVVLQERRLKSTSRGIWYTVSLLEKLNYYSHEKFISTQCCGQACWDMVKVYGFLLHLKSKRVISLCTQHFLKCNTVSISGNTIQYGWNLVLRGKLRALCCCSSDDWHVERKQVMLNLKPTKNLLGFEP